MAGAKKKVGNLTKKGLSKAKAAAVKGGNLKLMGEMLSNVSKTRSEISQTFARNARA
jgi:hypothetical protein